MEDIDGINKLIEDTFGNKSSLDVEIEAKTILGYRSVGEVVLDFSIVEEVGETPIFEYGKIPIIVKMFQKKF